MSLLDFHRMFPDETSARAFFETARWPDGVVCPHCGSHERSVWLKRWEKWQCNDCRKQFTVKVNTPMHRSHIDLHRWLLGMFLIMSSSKGITVWKLAEHLGLSYKAAWHMSHRIRAMMGDFGGPLSGVVEIDETYAGASLRTKASVPSESSLVSSPQTFFNDHNTSNDHNDSDDVESKDDGNDDHHTPPSGGGSGADEDFGKHRIHEKRESQNHHKMSKTGRGTARPMLLVAVERGGHSSVRPLVTHSRKALARALKGVSSEGRNTSLVAVSNTVPNTASKTVVMTDGLPAYKHLGLSHDHHTVTHSAKTFVRHQEGVPHPIHVNTAESWHSLFKRALVGVFHQVSSWHLCRYGQESAFRWNIRRHHILERLRVMVQGVCGQTLSFSTLTGQSPLGASQMPVVE